MAASFVINRTVEFSDTDMAGIAHFSRFFCWMEAAEHAFLRSLGLSVTMEWEGRRISFPRVSASADFLKPVRFEDVVTIAVSVARIGRSSVTYSFELTLRDEPVARGKIVSVCCQVLGEGKIEGTEIPSGIRSLLQSARS